MIKTICNRCGKEIDTNDFYCEIIVRRKTLLNLPAGNNQVGLRPGMVEERFVLCQECFDKIRKDFKK